METRRSVSYTHLDVYKRQEQELQEYLKIYQELTDVDYIQQMLQEENYQNHKIFETFAEKNFLDPVSYTHLGNMRRISFLQL